MRRALVNALVALGATLEPAGHAHRIFQIGMATLDALAVVSDLMERGERGAKAAQANRDYNAIRKALFTMGDPLLSSDPAYPVYQAGLTALRALVVLA